MRKLLISAILVVCLVSAFLTVSVASAHTLRSATASTPASCTYWQTDSETLTTMKGYQWDVSLLSFRACGSGQYLGKISDHDCVTVPPHQPFDLLMWNQWYINGNYISETSYRFFPPYNSTSGPYCSYSGSFLVSAGNNVENVAYLDYLGNTRIAGVVTLNDYSV